MTSSKNQQTEQRLIRRKEVQTKMGLGASSIYAMMKSGEFLLYQNLSKRRVALVESEVNQWIANRIAQYKVHTVVGV